MPSIERRRFLQQVGAAAVAGALLLGCAPMVRAQEGDAGSTPVRIENAFVRLWCDPAAGTLTAEDRASSHRYLSAARFQGRDGTASTHEAYFGVERIQVVQMQWPDGSADLVVLYDEWPLVLLASRLNGGSSGATFRRESGRRRIL